MITVLRPSGRGDLISAQVFEELFANQLASHVDVRPVSLPEWCETVLGPASSPRSFDDAARGFAEATSGADFVSPSYDAVALVPLLTALRNRSKSPTRILLIAHAPAACAMEWALLRPLLAPGDLVIAPTASAQHAIELLCPDLRDYVRTVPHPMNPLPEIPDGAETGVGGSEAPRLVSLTRFTAEKLLHRQIEAMALLRAGVGRAPRMHIAGQTTDADGQPLPYARGLQAKIRRLALQDTVRLCGPIRGVDEKARFLAGARLLLNLSVTVEESFGKAPVEALGAGVPVLATRWDGLVDTVGGCGALLPAFEVGPGFGFDVTAEQVAEGTRSLLEDPPAPEECRERAERFHPRVVAPQYGEVLRSALDRRSDCSEQVAPEDGDFSAAPDTGLLSRTAPLRHFAWGELFRMQAEMCKELRVSWETGQMPAAGDGSRLRNLVLIATRMPMERLMAGVETTDAILVGADDEGEPASGTPARASDDGFHARIAAAAGSSASVSSRMACLAELRHGGDTDTLRGCVEGITQDAAGFPGLRYLAAEVERIDGNFADAYEVCAGGDAPATLQEHDAYRLRQMARIARQRNRPREALPWLRDWLQRYPDSPESGPVWIDLCANLIGKDNASEHLQEAADALTRARDLLGDNPVVDKLEKLILAGQLVASPLVAGPRQAST